MRDPTLRLWLPLAAGLLLAGCNDESPSRETTAPTPADAPVEFSTGLGAHVTRFTSRGPTARLNFLVQEEETVVFGDLEVFRGGPTTDQQTFLQYSISRCGIDGECTTLNQGSGRIRNRDFVVRGQTMTLHTNTDHSVNPDFEQSSGSGGPIVLRWTPTSAFQGTFRESSRVKIGSMTIVHSQFVNTISSALATGTVLGFSVGEGGLGLDASLGTVREGILVIEKTP